MLLASIDTSGFVQLMTAFLGNVVVPLILFYLNKSEAKPVDSTVVPVGTPPTVAAARPRPVLLDLGFSLLCAAFFSMVLGHSILISGRAPVGLGWGMFGMLVLVLVNAFGAYLFWRVGYSELGLGVMAFVAILGIVLAPGGPIFGAAYAGENTLPSLLPLFLLIILASAAVFQIVLGLRGRDAPPRALRMRRLCVLSICALIGCISWVEGVEQLKFLSVVDTDPGVMSHEDAALFEEIRGLPIADQGTFYQLAMECLLAPTYARFASDISSAPQEVNASSADSNPRDQREMPPNESSEAPQMPLDHDVAIRPSSSPGMAGRILPLTELNSLVSAIPEDELLQYLLNRLDWVHPVPITTEAKVPINYPGASPAERLNNIASVRSYTALHDRPELRNTKFLSWSEASKARDAALNATVSPGKFGVPNDPHLYIMGEQDRIEYQKSRLGRQSPHTLAFYTHMALPPADEGYVAALAYSRANQIPNIQKDSIHWSSTDPVINMAIKLAAHVDETRKTNVSQANTKLGPTLTGLLGRFLEIKARNIPLAPESEAALAMTGRAFASSPDWRQANIVNHLAIALYRPWGSFAPSAFSLFFVQLKTWSMFVAHLCAALLFVPFFGIAVLFGWQLANSLRKRDRFREDAAVERLDRARPNGPQAEAASLVGRSAEFDVLDRIAGRGWTTCAIVGRRGVGKSRILSELHRRALSEEPNLPADGKWRPFKIAAWIVAPTQFEEADFVAGALNRLVTSVDDSIARKLGFEPRAIRELTWRATYSGLIGVAVCSMLLFCVFLVIRGSLVRPETVTTLIPLVPLIVAGFACVVIFVRRLQPVDLSRWLERRCDNEAQTGLLYQRSLEAKRFLDARRVGNANDEADVRWRTHLKGVLACVAIFAGYPLSMILSTLLDDVFGDMLGFMLGIVVYAFPFIGVGALVAITVRALQRASGTATDNGLMPLVAEYRAFATAIVYRLRQGALGNGPDPSASVLICVDELDKVVEMQELRTFVRRIKAIVEIPGCYYYFTLAEDALAELRRGPISGKTEIDSFVDHIVAIRALEFDDSLKLTSAYMLALGIESKGGDQQADKPEVRQAIAAISFGVPRDVLRNCDLYNDGANLLAGDFLRNRRLEKISLGYDARLLSMVDRDELSADLNTARGAIDKLLSSKTHAEETFRLILVISLILTLEHYFGQRVELRPAKLLEAVLQIGYRVPSDTIDNLFRDYSRLKLVIQSAPANIPQAAA